MIPAFGFEKNSRLRNRYPTPALLMRNDRGDENMADEEQHIATEDARSGSTPHIVRYILGISLPLVIIGMLIVLWSYYG